MATEIRTWLDFALLQSASETYLDGISLDSEIDIKEQLILGPNDPIKNPELSVKTKFTNEQATWFNDNYTIIDHLPNTASGFSATVFQNKQTGEFTISFRSTESRFGEFDEANDPQLTDVGGDWARDGKPGADGQINDVGFAFGQLEDMEEYYANIKQGRSAQLDNDGNIVTDTEGNIVWVENNRLSGLSQHLTSGGDINATGYSLGAHMATVFSMLHQDDLLETYIFNAPGIGAIRNESDSVFFHEPNPSEVAELLTCIPSKHMRQNRSKY